MLNLRAVDKGESIDEATKEEYNFKRRQLVESSQAPDKKQFGTESATVSSEYISTEENIPSRANPKEQNVKDKLTDMKKQLQLENLPQSESMHPSDIKSPSKPSPRRLKESLSNPAVIENHMGN